MSTKYATQALAKEGFGVLSDIDGAGALKKKAGLGMPTEVKERLKRVLAAW